MSLNTNITNLQEILNKVNTLPDAETLEDELNSQSALISEQNAKIAELADVLANKAGNKNIQYDTCTISINPAGGSLFGYCITCFDGEKVLQKYNFSTNNLGSVTITDVICGSTFSIVSKVDNGTLSSANLIQIGSMNSRGAIFITPTQPGAIASIQIGSSSTGGSSD